ncbi:MAG: motility protein A [Candidatus Binataceae bacterium]|jgi:chemotaxis protein MotA
MSKSRFDTASIVGLLLGPACILMGQLMEGGKLTTLLQTSAALIVIGASIGACMLSFPGTFLMAAARDVRKVVAETSPDPFDLVDRIINYSNVFHKEGAVALQSYVPKEPYPMLSMALNLLVSNVSPESMMGILERKIAENTRLNNAGAEVFEAAGGYLPTFGIMGAVLGLIHTMSMLSEPEKLGEGIATAFVATLYGVGTANLLAYPIGKKIRARAHTEKELDKIVITAIKGIQSGQRGIALRQTLTAGSHGAPQAGGGAEKPARIARKDAA